MSTVESIARPRRNGERRRAPTASISKESPVFFFNDTATTEIYPLPLHDALPISHAQRRLGRAGPQPAQPPPAPLRDRLEPHHPRQPAPLAARLPHHRARDPGRLRPQGPPPAARSHSVHRPERLRSEEHTSELQSP